MELIIYRIAAAVGIVAIVVMIGIVYMGVIERLRKRAERKKYENALKRAEHGYAIRKGGIWYIADTKELETARRIIKVDEYGLWETERGMGGPWKLKGERHD